MTVDFAITYLFFFYQLLSYVNVLFKSFLSEKRHILSFYDVSYIISSIYWTKLASYIIFIECNQATTFTK